MIRFACIVILSLIHDCAVAQELDSALQRQRKIVMGFYSSGFNVYGDFNSLNNAIAPAGYPTVANQYTGGSFGFSFRRADKNSYSSFALSFCRSSPSPFYDNNRNKDTRVNMLEFSISNHFDLTTHPKWLVYPSFGFGFGSAHLTLYDNLIGQTSFAASISNLSVPTSKQWSAGYVFVDLGVGVERKFRVWIYDFYLGGGAGYRLSTNAKFREAYQNYSDAPSVQLSGLTWNFKIRFELWKNSIRRQTRQAGY